MDLAKDLSNLKEFVSQQKITKIDPAKLTKHPTNDFHDIEGEQWEKFKDSIDSIGIIHPIIIDTRNRVLSGWQRTRAASILGIKTPAIVIPITSQDVARKIAVIMNLSVRQLSRDQWDKLWMEIYGKRVETMLVKKNLPPGTIARILSKESGIGKTQMVKRVEAIRNKMAVNLSDLSSLAIQRLIKKAQSILAEMHKLRGEYFKVRDKLAGHIKMTDAGLPAITIREEATNLPIPNIVFEKHYGHSKGIAS